MDSLIWGHLCHFCHAFQVPQTILKLAIIGIVIKFLLLALNHWWLAIRLRIVYLWYSVSGVAWSLFTSNCCCGYCDHETTRRRESGRDVFALTRGDGGLAQRAVKESSEDASGSGTQPTQSRWGERPRGHRTPDTFLKSPNHSPALLCSLRPSLFTFFACIVKPPGCPVLRL